MNTARYRMRSITRLTARLKVQLGMTAECLPEPPATITKTSSGAGTCGSIAESSVTFCIQRGQSCMPHMPPSLSRPSGSLACSKTKRCTSALVKPSAAMVAACSGPSTTRSWLWEKYQPTLEPRVAATPGAAHVHQDQPDGAADGRVGPEARAEQTRARAEPDGAGPGSAHDHQRRHGMRGCLDAVEVEGGVEHGLEAGDDHREAGGLAAGHHRVHSELLERALPPERGHEPQRLAAAGARPRQHGVDPLASGRDDGQTVAPFPPDELAVDVFFFQHR